MDFSCVEECAQCCIERHYYPSKKFGKVGVLILPDEKQKIEDLAKQHNLGITILPRIGISYKSHDGPEQIIAYQMMGKEKNGNTCPFLDTESDKKSPHGGFTCKIYSERPLACAAYPLLQTSPIVLDDHCKFCQYHTGADGNLETEKEALIKIQTKMSSSAPIIWRYATGVGEDKDKDAIKNGWIREF